MDFFTRALRPAVIFRREQSKKYEYRSVGLEPMTSFVTDWYNNIELNDNV